MDKQKRIPLSQGAREFFEQAGRQGGKARAKNMTADEKTAHAKKMLKARREKRKEKASK